MARMPHQFYVFHAWKICLALTNQQGKHKTHPSRRHLSRQRAPSALPMTNAIRICDAICESSRNHEGSRSPHQSVTTRSPGMKPCTAQTNSARRRKRFNV